LGVGRVMNPAIRVRSLTPLVPPRSLSSGNAAIQVVVLHGNLSAEGQLSETEILASTDPSLNESALDRAKQWNNFRQGGTQPGATPQGQQIIFTYEFVAATH
jgi:hypothetical protein